MLVPDAWLRVVCSRCLVSGAWLRLTEYKVISYEKLVFNSLKRCYLWVFFLHFVFSLLFASFNFTKLQFIVVSSLMFFDSHSRSLFHDGFHKIYSVLLWFGVLGFGCLVPGCRFKVLVSRCLVPVDGIHGYLLKTVRLYLVNTVLSLCRFFFHLVFSLLFALFNSTKVNRS